MNQIWRIEKIKPKVLKAKSILANKQVVRFILSGVTSAGVEFLVFVILVHIRIDLFLSALVSFVCGLMASYVLNSRFVFGAKFESKKKESIQMFLFTVLGAFNALVSSWLVVLFSNYVPNIVAKILGMVMIAIWNFVIMKKIIFRGKSYS